MGRPVNFKKKEDNDSDSDLYEHDLLLDMDDDDEEERAVILSNKAITFRNSSSASPATKSYELTIQKPMPKGVGLLDNAGSGSDSETHSVKPQPDFSLYQAVYKVDSSTEV